MFLFRRRKKNKNNRKDLEPAQQNPVVVDQGIGGIHKAHNDNRRQEYLRTVNQHYSDNEEAEGDEEEPSSSGGGALSAEQRHTLTASMATAAAGIIAQRKSMKNQQLDGGDKENDEPNLSSNDDDDNDAEEDDDNNDDQDEDKRTASGRLSVQPITARPRIGRGSRRLPTVSRQFQGGMAAELLKQAGVDAPKTSEFDAKRRQVKSSPIGGYKPITPPSEPAQDLPSTSPLKMNLTLDGAREQRKKSETNIHNIHPLSLRIKQGYEFFETKGTTYRVRSGWRKADPSNKNFDGYGVYRMKTERDWELVRDQVLKVELLNELKEIRAARASMRASLHRKADSTSALPSSSVSPFMRQSSAPEPTPVASTPSAAEEAPAVPAPATEATPAPKKKKKKKKKTVNADGTPVTATAKKKKKKKKKVLDEHGNPVVQKKKKKKKKKPVTPPAEASPEQPPHGDDEEDDDDEMNAIVTGSVSVSPQYGNSNEQDSEEKQLIKRLSMRRKSVREMAMLFDK